MRFVFLARDDADLDSLEPGLLEPAVQIAFGKAGPTVSVQLVRLLKVVSQ